MAARRRARESPVADRPVEETAEVLHVSNDTIKRDWRLAKLWLLRELSGGES